MAPAILGIFIVLIAVTVAAQPADDLTPAPDDSLDAASPDSLGAAVSDEESLEAEGHDGEDDEEVGVGRRRRRRAGSDSLPKGIWSYWILETRPDVQLKIDRQKDVTNWDTDISVNRQVSPKLRFSLGATLRTQENSTLNRSDSNDGTSASLKYQLSDGMGFSLRYNSAVSAYRYDLKKAEPAERRRKQSVSVSADFNRDLTSALNVRLGTSAGTTQNSYASVSNQGSQQDLAASLSFTPMDNLKTSISYNARRLLLDSRVDSSGTAVFTSTDLTFSQDLGLSVKYDVVPGIKISIDASQGDKEQQNPDPARKQQETENRTSRKAGITTAFDLLEWATWSASADFSESRADFLLQSDRSNFIKNSSLRGSAKLLPWRGATVNLGGTREETRSEYQTPDTGNDIHKSVSVKLNQDLGPKADLDVTALADLVSVFYDDKDENPKDRDRLNSRVSVNVRYDPAAGIKTRLGAEVSDDKTIYIRSERSASNRTTRRYRISGDYDLATFYNTSLSQNYDISALYSFYDYAEENNTLVRNSNVRTQFKIPLTSNLDLNLNHNYQFQDQGKYAERGRKGFYARSSEKETHTMGAVCRYTPFRYVTVIVRQTYRIQRNWTYKEGQKSLDYETPTSDISGRINFSYTIGETTKISLKLEQNRKEGSNVSEAFKNYRNIEFEASHVF